MNAVARWGLILFALVGLGIDAYTHLDLAHLYMGNTTGTVNQGVLFQVEAGLAIGAGLWLLVRPGVLSILATLMITGGGAAALVVYRYYDIGKIGPLPNMHEPIWYTKKEWSLAGELIAFAAALALLALTMAARRRSGRPVRTSVPA
ncbi:MAG TPA: hypothetical protein VGN35_05180 [Jatrophihabitantaceae bacterium]|jgi:multisubunit Na+/H+ antiporter MnhC subunit|nr:hypothetical protein [Jatrophihabitantaceae bacterium]